MSLESGCFLYRSRTALNARSSDFQAILIAARRRNQELGLTGYLHYEDGHFYQWLEGPAEALAQVAALVEARKHSGMMVPAPVQHAMAVALGDDGHVAEQKARYRRRREVLLPALRNAGYTVDASEAGLYLWTRRAETDPATATADDSWSLLGELADLGIVAGPGVFYGEAGNGYVRVALTAPCDAVEEAARRLDSIARG